LLKDKQVSHLDCDSPTTIKTPHDFYGNIFYNLARCGCYIYFISVTITGNKSTKLNTVS